MRELSPEMLEEVFAQFNPSTLVMLLRFVGVDNQGATQEHRYVNDWKPITSNGVTYQPAGFRVGLAGDNPDNMPSVTLTVPAADDQIVRQLREFDTAPKVYVSMVVAERPDLVEYEETEFEVGSWVADSSGLKITLETEPVLNEPIPSDLITPTLHPLLWENVLIESIYEDDDWDNGGGNPPTDPTDPPTDPTEPTLPTNPR